MDRDLIEQLQAVGPGRRVGGDPVDEAAHFFVCDTCGQAVDMRDLAEVVRHEMSDHEARATS